MYTIYCFTDNKSKQGRGGRHTGRKPLLVVVRQSSRPAGASLANPARPTKRLTRQTVSPGKDQGPSKQRRFLQNQPFLKG